VYGGTLDVVSGKLTVDRVFVDMGTLNYYKNGDRFGCTIENAKSIDSWSVESPIAICSQYKYAPVIRGNGIDNIFGFNAGSVFIRDTRYNTAEELRSALTGVQLVYELNTPTEIQLTPQEIVRTLLGENNIWSDGGDVEVEYPADTKMYIDQKITEAIAAAFA
jgi:hypothetical protein